MCYDVGMTTTPILTIAHNNIGRPIECVGLPNGYEGRSGISPFAPDELGVAEWVRTVERYGAAIVTDNRTPRPYNHHVIGVGSGHDDANWCESRFQEGSHAAWTENSKGAATDAATYSDGRPMYPREIDALRRRRH